MCVFCLPRCLSSCFRITKKQTMKKIETKTAFELNGDADLRVKVDLVFGSRTFVDTNVRANKWQITGSEGLRKAHFACGEDWRTHVCF